MAVEFPETFGHRASTPVAMAIVADAVRRSDSVLADAVATTQSWRSGYLEHFAALTALSARSAGTALAVADDGLAAMHLRLRHLREGQETSLDTIDWDNRAELTAVTVSGRNQPARELSVPYWGRQLSGQALRDQLRRWADAGVVEQGFVETIHTVIDNPELLTLPGRQLALVGAGAEMGPLEPFSAWGAEMLAIDVPAPAVWGRIHGTVEARAGKVTSPVQGNITGLDIAAQVPEAAAWISNNADPSKKLVFGMYGYADGAKHVLLTAAADAVATKLLTERDGTALAYLGTPTDSYLVPEDVMDEARSRWHKRGPLTSGLQGAARTLTRDGVFRPAYAQSYQGGDGTSWGVADIMLPMQGPNYALAKRLQRWRSLAAARDGHTVSFNVAPASWTRSVTKNRVFNMAYSGAHRFGVEIFPADTARWLMAAKLAADLAEPTPGQTRPRHPEAAIFADANHGGFWRQPFDPKSVLSLAAVAGVATASLPARTRRPR